jgi:hypothetical protein
MRLLMLVGRIQEHFVVRDLEVLAFFAYAAFAQQQNRLAALQRIGRDGPLFQCMNCCCHNLVIALVSFCS